MSDVVNHRMIIILIINLFVPCHSFYQHLPLLLSIKIFFNFYHFQHTFKSLKKLKILRLDDNKLKVRIFWTSIQPKNYQIMSEWREYLKNKFQDINGLLQSQTELRKLNVSSNRLQWFDYAFIPKVMLKLLLFYICLLILLIF